MKCSNLRHLTVFLLLLSSASGQADHKGDAIGISTLPSRADLRIGTNTVEGTKLLPVLNHPIADLSTISKWSVSLDLNDSFGTEPIDDQVVRFTSQFSNAGPPSVMDMALFSNRTPVTRENFLIYVAKGSYVNSFIHRSIPGFVIQGGASRIVENSIVDVPTGPPIVNEFGVSNTLGTISMAKLGGNPDSATSQWFISIGENSGNLDLQNGGFTVFARITQETLKNAQTFGDPASFPTFNYGGIYNELPLWHEHVPTNLQISEFILFPSVTLVPLPAGQAGESATLSYSVISNSNPSVATASIQSSASLNLVPLAGVGGSTIITVRATDSVGNTVDNSFTLNVDDSATYASWMGTHFPGETNPATIGATADPDNDGINNAVEIVVGGNPASAMDASLLPTVSRVVNPGGTIPAGDYFLFAYRRTDSSVAGGVVSGVQYHTDMLGTWTDAVHGSNGVHIVTTSDSFGIGVSLVQVYIPRGANSNLFARLRVIVN